MQGYKCKDLIYRVLAVEAPIHIDECFERITRYLSIKSPKQYYASYKMCLKEEIKNGRIIEKNQFLYLKYTDIKIRNRNTPYYEVFCGKLNINYIPPDEIIIIAKILIKLSFSIHEDELAKLVSKEIGFNRMTQKISDTVYGAFELLKNDDEIKYKLGRYSLVPTIQTNDIIKIAKRIIRQNENIREKDLVKFITEEIAPKATKNTKNVLYESLKILKNDSEIKYQFCSYSIYQKPNNKNNKTMNFIQENHINKQNISQKNIWDFIVEFFNKYKEKNYERTRN